MRPVFRGVAGALGAAATLPFAIACGAAVRTMREVADATQRGIQLIPDVPTPAPSLGLGAAVAVDTLIAMPMRLLSSAGSPDGYAASSSELDHAVKFYDEAGWLSDASTRHRMPPAPDDVRSLGSDARGVESVEFASGWDPVDGEPGGDRWRSFTANATVTVRLLRHGDGPRPWLVAVHGQGMGRPSDDRWLRMRRVHDELGVNVALPVLPLHGPRRAGFAPEQQFVSNVFPVNNVLGVSQAVWDVRRLVAWLRESEGASDVGVLGLSLGSYVVSVLATLDAELACVIALVPQPDLAGSLRAVDPAVPSRRRLHRDLYDERVDVIHHPVSPLSSPCAVPHERRFIVAGQVDRIAGPEGAAQLARHWEEASVLWRPRGHVTTCRSSVFDDHLAMVLAGCGLTAEPARRITVAR